MYLCVLCESKRNEAFHDKTQGVTVSFFYNPKTNFPTLVIEHDAQNVPPTVLNIKNCPWCGRYLVTVKEKN